MRWILFFILAARVVAADTVSVGLIKDALSAAIKSGQTPGAVLWMARGEEETHWAQGYCSLVPAKQVMTEDTVFDAASLTKVVATAPSIMLLIEQGKIDPSAPVQRYLTAYPHAAILVKHLLTHTSGLPSGIPKDETNPDWSGYEEGIKRALACVPDQPPGSAFRYSDVNFILLGEIVHRVSGQTLDMFAKANVFEPLKMKSTGYLPSKSLLPRIAPTERDADGNMLRGVVHDPTARRMDGVAGHAGLFTTAADLARYAKAIMRGEVDGIRLLKPETLKLMASVQSSPSIAEKRGFGWDIDTRYSRPRGTGFPVGSFGHTGWTGTAMWMDPASDSFYILLTTRLHPDGKGNVRDLYEETGTLVAKALNVRPAVPTTLNGIDVLKRDRFTPLKGLRLGLITNHTGIDNERNATIDLLAKAPGVKLIKLFSPEHGIRGELDVEKIDNTKDARTGLPVISLYSDKKRAPTNDDLVGLDALVFDIQDIGTRFYTYIATLKNCLEAASKAKLKFIVLDRVNPIRGDRIEGPTEVDKAVFTAIHPIPLRHGMTTGELAQMFNTEAKLGAALQVIKVEGWQRDQWLDASALPWQNPSPNMRNLNAATLYPGIGLLEYAISVGRGTDTPFEVIGAPFIDDRVLAYELNKLALSGIRFQPVQFTPTASVFEKKPCGGVRLLITDRDSLRPVTLGLAIGHTLHRLYAKDFDLTKFNTLLNHNASIEMIKTAKPWQEINAAWESQAKAFEERRKTFLLY
jgi:uncharacterized protein YbbC (DUF1343 family)